MTPAKLVSAILVASLIYHYSEAAKPLKLPSSITSVFGKGLAFLLGQKYEPESSVPESFKSYALHDESNDDIAELTVQQIIEWSGFRSETHKALADDGYITELIRIVNPLADQRKLKQPPVLLLQGGISDQSIWIWASAIQHHPEEYPRVTENGPMSSWNRSLGFVLANNGYDVWLVGTRGSNSGNKGHVKYKGHLDWMEDVRHKDSNNRLSPEEDRRSLLETLGYWDYSLDDLANYELSRQIDAVMNITQANKITLVPISLSSIFSMMFISAHPEYKQYVDKMVIVAPIANNRGTNNLLGNFHRGTCKYLPTELGTIIYTEILLTRVIRNVIVLLAKSKELRYSLIKALTTAFAGPSSRYQTLLEPGVLAKLALPTSFKEIKHYCQQVVAGRLQRYDYGSSKNRRIYGTMTPKKYDMGAVDFGKWMVISGGNDKFATIDSVRQYIRASKTPPIQHIFIEKYNHLDLIAGLDNDVLVNLPILEFLDRDHTSQKLEATEDHDSLKMV